MAKQALPGTISHDPHRFTFLGFSVLALSFGWMWV
jgi:hypothetical protein